ncbi:PKD domain-containing protein [Mangrovibacterium sp.]|uniref:PKD domain-containing protein n=1 Tax=Mangrovibacterium sp. TaxID=1961364 RepID=UPI0035678B46
MNRFIYVIGLLFLSLQLVGQDLCERSTEGTEFWLGFMEGRNDNPYGHDLTISVTSSYDTKFSIYIDGGTTLYGSYSIGSNSDQIVTISWELVEVTNSEEIETKGIYLKANDPVNVYAMNHDYKSADAAVIYPTESIGKEYFTLCYEPHFATYSALVDGVVTTGYNGRNSEFLIVATEDDTQVTVTPSKVTAGLKPANIPFTIQLNKGQTYQVQSANSDGLTGQGDLTGSYIAADKNIAVYSGNFATTVPRLSQDPFFPDNLSGYDHLYEQMPPLYSWGKEYYAVPLMGRVQDFYRIIASQDGTTVDVGEFWDPFVLNRGEFKEIILGADQATPIIADKPILVAQYSASQTYSGGALEYGDPSMIVLSSSAQSKNNVTFVAYESASITSYHINIISLTDQVANLRLDGNTVSATPFAGTKYSYAQVLLNSSGSHTLLNTEADEGFLAYVYGQGDKESYGYPVGFNLNIVLDLGESSNFEGDTLLLCAGDTLTLDPGPYFDSYAWSTGETKQSIRVAEEGLYKVTTTVSDCPSLQDSVYVLYSNPQVTIEADRFYDCAPAEISLQAVSTDAVSFLWESMEGDSLTSDQTIVVDSTALFRVTVTNQYGCQAMDTTDVIVFGNPPVTINADTLVCGDLKTTLSVDLGSYPDSLWNTAPGGFQWSSNNPAVLFDDQSDASATIQVPAYGIYEVYYKLTTKDGCESGDTLEMEFSVVPSLNIIADRFYDCSASTITLVGDTPDPASVSFQWFSAEGDLLSTNQSLDVDSTALYLLSVEDEFGCIAVDTADVIIFGNPPVTIHTVDAQCGDLTALVEVDFAGYPDSLWNVSGSFLWSSPNLELDATELASATVTAPDYGVYEVSYQLETKDGCVSSSNLEIEFLQKPSASFSFNFQPVCHSYTETLQFTGTASSEADLQWTLNHATITNSIDNGVYDVLIDEYSGEKPSIQLIVDDGGCRDTAYMEEPDSFADERNLSLDFTASDTISCDSLETQLFVSLVQAGLQYTWESDLGTGSGERITVHTSEPGFYDVSLTAFSAANGCKSTLTKVGYLQLLPAPIAAFSVDNPIVSLDQSLVTFRNSSQYADSYTWIFGDGNQSTVFEPTHEYLGLGTYQASLIADSDAGCADSSSMSIQVVLDQLFAPNAFRPDSDIPENRTFMPTGLGLNGTTFTLQIFDRWGQVIFESYSADNPWIGTNKMGEDAPMGNYIWLATYRDQLGVQHKQKGQILLIR